MDKTQQQLVKLRSTILSLKFEAVALKSRCHDDETTIKANCQGRVWVLDKLLVEVGNIIDAFPSLIDAQ